jgi:hypothetical protein
VTQLESIPLEKKNKIRFALLLLLKISALPQTRKKRDFFIAVPTKKFYRLRYTGFAKFLSDI